MGCRRSATPSNSATPTYSPSDLCGPVKPATPGGWSYFLLLVDDATRYKWVVLLAAKSEAAGVIKRV
jgi:hypothetical protein